MDLNVFKTESIIFKMKNQTKPSILKSVWFNFHEWVFIQLNHSDLK